MQFFYPPIIGIEELSVLLKRSVAVIIRDRSIPERRHTLPPAKKAVDTKNPLWVTEDVITWLRDQPDDPPKPSIKKMGAPTKRERIDKRKASEKQTDLITSESRE